MKNFINQLHISNFWDMVSVNFENVSLFFPLLLGLMGAKILILYVISAQRKKAENPISLLFFAIPIITYLAGEIAWIFFLLDVGMMTKLILRMAWHMQPLQFYAQVLFLRSVVIPKYYLGEWERLILEMLTTFTLLPLITLIIPEGSYDTLTSILFESFFFVGSPKRALIKFFGFGFLLINMVMIAKKVLFSKTTPYFLQLQLKSFFMLLLISLIPEIILASANIFPSLYFLNDNILLTFLSSIFFTIPLLFVVRRLYHLRFLNLTNRVVGPTSRLTDDDLLAIKNRLCKSTSMFELPLINAHFFDELLHIEAKRVLFYLRREYGPIAPHNISQTFERFKQEKPELVARFMMEDSILVYDELAFTNFYEPSAAITDVLQFMEQINAAVFLPLRQKDRFFGAFIITKEKEKKELFSKSVQMQMQLYGTFIVYALARFERAEYEALLEKYRALAEELHKANQKNSHFFDLLTSLLKRDPENDNGILFFKNAQFTFINIVAKELLQIDPNNHQGHPLTKALKELVRRVQQYDKPQMIIEKNASGKDICCQGFPSKNNEIVILLSVANITKTLSLDDTLLLPADMDYTIFLQATPSGIMVNDTIPGGGSIVQKAKVYALKVLLSKKAILFNVQEEDIDMMLSIAQRVCHKTALRTIDAAKHGDHDTISTLLFGKQHFGMNEIIAEHGLLYAFDESGIIHIANAHFLDLKTQQLLIHFLKTGLFCLHKSEQQFTSNATIIFSSSDDLELLTKQGVFAKELYDYLKDSLVTLPNLATLPFAELESLVQSFQKQRALAAEYNHLFEFTKEELEHLNMHRPHSYYALQKTINSLTEKKINKSFAGEVKQAHAKIEIHDETLLQAARLGKKTLKDRKLMRALWDKLQNQSRIAEIINVDRSSVHRRLKEYGIGN